MNIHYSEEFDHYPSNGNSSLQLATHYIEPYSISHVSPKIERLFNSKGEYKIHWEESAGKQNHTTLAK